VSVDVCVCVCARVCGREGVSVTVQFVSVCERGVYVLVCVCTFVCMCVCVHFAVRAPLMS